MIKGGGAGGVGELEERRRARMLVKLPNDLFSHSTAFFFLFFFFFGGEEGKGGRRILICACQSSNHEKQKHEICEHEQSRSEVIASI